MDWRQNLYQLQRKNPIYRRLRGGWNPRPCIRQDREPSTLPTELWRPLTSDAVSGRTESPALYPLSYSGP